MKKRFNGPLDYTKLSRDDIIDLILELKDEKCIDVYYNVAYGLTDLIFGEMPVITDIEFEKE